MSIFARFFKKKPKPSETMDEVSLIYDLLRARNSGTMVDVGAHFGESLRQFAKQGWRVLAFEPDDDPRKQQAIREQLNPHSKLLNCALSDTRVDMKSFYRSAISTGISGLIPFHESHQVALQVEVTVLADVLQSEGIQRIDFLKIDTEGNDLLVLKGLDWQVKPDVILCEFEDAKTKTVGYDYKVLGDYLLAAGYHVFMSEWYPIIRYGVTHRWRALREYPCEVQDASAWGNFIAVSAACDRQVGGSFRVLSKLAKQRTGEHR
jgi:FkbM family methyltransferase